MRATSIILLAGAFTLTLAGCTVQNLPNGGVAFNPVPMNQIFATGQSKPSYGAYNPMPITSAFPTAIDVPQNYAGPLEGGAGTMTITRRNANTYQVYVSVSSNDGAGQVDGFAYRQGSSLVMTQGYLPPGRQMDTCDLNFTPENGRVSVGETNCMMFHGAQVSFDGVLSKVN